MNTHIDAQSDDIEFEDFINWLSDTDTAPADFVVSSDYKEAWLIGCISVLDRQIADVTETGRHAYKNRLKNERLHLQTVLDKLRE